MSQPVKRNYSSTLRDMQARETRRTVVHAGARLFVADGFGRTTIDAIAAAAGVSRKTVFTSVGGKVEILKLAIDWAIAGDDEPVALADRPEVARMRTVTDPREVVAGWADIGVPISARVSGLYQALVVAAAIDDHARDLLATTKRQRLGGARDFVGHLAEVGGLRDGVSVERAADIALVYNDPHLYVTLVSERGWSQRAFTQYVKDCMSDQLLRRD